MPKKIVVVPTGTTTAGAFGLLFVSYRPYGRYLFIESTRDSLIILAYRIPRGTNFVCASRDNCYKYCRTSFTAYRDDRFAKKRVVSYCYIIAMKKQWLCRLAQPLLIECYLENVAFSASRAVRPVSALRATNCRRQSRAFCFT